MRLDFWQFSRGPIERIVAQIAQRARSEDARVLIVDGDADRRAAISRALWSTDPEAFLANGEAGTAHDARQPILISGACEPANSARFAVFSDGEWRDGGDRFDRTILLFGEAQVEAARAVWRQFDGRTDVTRGYFAQEDGKWIKQA